MDDTVTGWQKPTHAKANKYLTPLKIAFVIAIVAVIANWLMLSVFHVNNEAWAVLSPHGSMVGILFYSFSGDAEFLMLNLAIFLAVSAIAKKKSGVAFFIALLFGILAGGLAMYFLEDPYTSITGFSNAVYAVAGLVIVQRLRAHRGWMHVFVLVLVLVNIAWSKHITIIGHITGLFAGMMIGEDEAWFYSDGSKVGNRKSGTEKEKNDNEEQKPPVG